MKKIIERIKEWFNDGLRGICGRMTPDRRVITIVILLVVFAGINFYFTFSAIYNIGREDAKYEFVDSPIVIPELEFPEEEPDELQGEIEDFFNEHVNTQENDTTTEE